MIMYVNTYVSIKSFITLLVTMQNTPMLFDWEINIERVRVNPLLKNET